MKITIVGAGRAGTSFATALERVGHRTLLLSHHEHALVPSSEPDVVMLCVPDATIANVAHSLARGPYVVAHVAGSKGLDVLNGHERVGSLHPLATLPSGERGASRLRGATFCVSGDPLMFEIVASLEGKIITVGEEQRTLYHASATAASNHLVALMGHVQSLAVAAGLDLEDFLSLSRQALEDVVEFGPVNALTGPASRGDVATIAAHVAAIPESERHTYVALSNAALALQERRRALVS